MALVVKDRIKETTATTGTGTLTLAGAVTKFQSFNVVGDGNTTYYAIESGNGTDWEIGVGTYTASGTTLSRDTILESSNAGSAINLSGTSTVFCTYPAERSVNTADIGTTIQAYDADTAKYDDTTANFTGTLQNGGSNVVVDTDIGSTVQAYDADTTKNDIANTFTANQTINGDLTVDTNTLVVDSTNNRVGIGTASPGRKLHINSGALDIAAKFESSDADVGIVFADSNTVNEPEIRVVTDDFLIKTGASERMRITSTGNVGIGTSSPAGKLQVNAPATTAPSLTFGASSGQILRNENSEFALGLWNANPYPLYIQGRNSGNAARDIVIQPLGGNVGIGTSSPLRPLQIGSYGSGNGEITLASATTGIGSILFGDGGTGSDIYRGYVQYNHSSDAMLFATSASERMRIDSSGNVGIGTTSPDNNSNYKALSITGATGGQIYWRSTTSSVTAYAGADSNGGYLATYTGHALILRTNNTERMRITSSGYVGINTSGPVGLLHIRNTNDGTSVGSGVASLIFNHQSGTYTTGNYYNSIAFARPNSNGSTIGAFISPVIAGSSSAHLAFGTDAGAGVLERMRIGANGDLSFNSGYGSVATAYGCRAWVNFNGTGTVAIREDGNVSSITDNGTGDYTINFSTAMPDINYTIVASANTNTSYSPQFVAINTRNNATVAPTTTACRISCVNYAGQWIDESYVNVAIFR